MLSVTDKKNISLAVVVATFLLFAGASLLLSDTDNEDSDASSTGHEDESIWKRLDTSLGFIFFALIVCWASNSLSQSLLDVSLFFVFSVSLAAYFAGDKDDRSDFFHRTFVYIIYYILFFRGGRQQQHTDDETNNNYYRTCFAPGFTKKYGLWAFAAYCAFVFFVLFIFLLIRGGESDYIIAVVTMLIMTSAATSLAYFRMQEVMAEEQQAALPLVETVDDQNSHGQHLQPTGEGISDATNKPAVHSETWQI